MWHSREANRLKGDKPGGRTVTFRPGKKKIHEFAQSSGQAWLWLRLPSGSVCGLLAFEFSAPASALAGTIQSSTLEASAGFRLIEECGTALPLGNSKISKPIWIALSGALHSWHWGGKQIALKMDDDDNGSDDDC